MSRAMRISLVLAAALAAVVAFAVLRPDDERAAVSQSASQARDEPAASSEGGDDGAAAKAPPTPAAKPKPPLLEAGTVRKLSIRKGETVSFRVRHPSPEEIHVHGYDVTRAVPAGKIVTVRFPARIEGIFEIEFHGSGTHIASLTVEP